MCGSRTSIVVNHGNLPKFLLLFWPDQSGLDRFTRNDLVAVGDFSLIECSAFDRAIG